VCCPRQLVRLPSTHVQGDSSPVLTVCQGWTTHPSWSDRREPKSTVAKLVAEARCCRGPHSGKLDAEARCCRGTPSGKLVAEARCCRGTHALLCRWSPLTCPRCAPPTAWAPAGSKEPGKIWRQRSSWRRAVARPGWKQRLLNTLAQQLRGAAAAGTGRQHRARQRPSPQPAAQGSVCQEPPVSYPGTAVGSSPRQHKRR